MRQVFRSLAVRNYRLFFTGQVISISGTWMQTVAQTWLVLHISQSAVALGITSGLQFGPMLLFGVGGGVIADRFDKRKVLLATQGSCGLLAAGLAWLTLSGQATLPAVYAFALALGIVNAIDTPVRQSFVSELVGPSLLSNAISLNSAVFTSGRVLGPMLAGILIALAGTGWCFAYNALSYVAILIALLRMQPREFHRPAQVAADRAIRLTAGMSYAWKNLDVRVPMLLLAVIGVFAFNFNILLPLMATRVFQGGSAAYGLLFSALGLGSLVGALLVASRGQPTIPRVSVAALAFGILLSLSAIAPELLIEVATLALIGVTMSIYQASTNATVQLASEAGVRGRVMALYAAIFLGGAAIGGPIVGSVAQMFGPRPTTAGGGVVAIVAALAAIIWWRRSGQGGSAAPQAAGIIARR